MDKLTAENAMAVVQAWVKRQPDKVDAVEGETCGGCGGKGRALANGRWGGCLRCGGTGDYLYENPSDVPKDSLGTGLIGAQSTSTPNTHKAAMVALLTVPCERCKGRGFYTRDGIGLVPQLDHYFNCYRCGGDGEELYQTDEPVQQWKPLGRGSGRVPFDLDAELDVWPEPAREAIELAYWQQVAHAAGFDYREPAEHGRDWRCFILSAVPATKYWVKHGATACEAAREAIVAAFSKEVE